MPEELFPNLYRIHVPLPKNPLKYINSYVIKSDQRNLVIDTGLNRGACLEAMQEGLKELDIDPERTDYFITHFHADHFALVTRLISQSSRVFFNRPDSEFIKSWINFDALIAYARRNGFPEDDLQLAINNHPAHRFGPGYVPHLDIVEEGHVFELSGYCFTTVMTPGHTPGHMCLYEPGRKILIAGDHLLIDITPNIQCWSDEGNPLKSYIESLNKVYDLEVSQVLPGHRRLFTDHRRRVDELKKHHADRAAEVLRVVRDAPLNAYQAASKMTWDIRCDNWEDFPVAQRWFATGEAISHLRLLEKEGKISRRDEGGLIIYFS